MGRTVAPVHCRGKRHAARQESSRNAQRWFPGGLGVGNESAELAALGVPLEGVDGVDVHLGVGESEVSEFVCDGR